MPLYGGVELPGQPDLENIRKLDLMILPQINRMSRVGIAVDVPYLNELSSQFGTEMAALEKEIASYIPAHALHQFVSSAARVDAAAEEAGTTIDFNAGSADQIRKLVFELLDVGRDQKLKSTTKGISTGRKNLDLCREDHPVVPLVIQYRERSKLKQAFADALPKKARLHPRSACCPLCELPHVEPTNRVHTTFTTTRAITGRLSSKAPNLQQIPTRSKLGMRIRAAFVASPGTKLVSVDFSQMEVRDMAHLANSKPLIDIYQAGKDVHQMTAMRAFVISDPDKVDKYQHRLPAKRTIFGIQNGNTGKGLRSQLVGDYWAAGIVPPGWLTEDWCQAFINKTVAMYGLQPYFDLCHYRARRYKFVWNPWGRVRYIPQVCSTLPWKVEEGLREAQNFAVTSSNAEQTKLAMAECEELFTTLTGMDVWAWPLLSIHDQVIAEVEDGYAAQVGEQMSTIFRDVMNDRETGERLWRCPIDSDCEVLDRWKNKD